MGVYQVFARLPSEAQASEPRSGLRGKESSCSAGDAGAPALIPGWGGFKEEGVATHSCSCWEDSMGRGAQRAAGRGVTRSRT